MSIVLLNNVCAKDLTNYISAANCGFCTQRESVYFQVGSVVEDKNTWKVKEHKYFHKRPLIKRGFVPSTNSEFLYLTCTPFQVGG